MRRHRQASISKSPSSRKSEVVERVVEAMKSKSSEKKKKKITTSKSVSEKKEEIVEVADAVEQEWNKQVK